jgi:hypothetical protein
MSEHKERQRNITLTITLDLETQLYVISGSIPNPSFGVMLAEVLHEEMRFRMRSALATEAARAQVAARGLLAPGGRA